SSGMDRLNSLLIEVWREACRHIEIDQSTDTIAQIVVRRLPVDRLNVRRVEADRSAVTTVAVGLATTMATPVGEVTEVASTRGSRLLAWCRQGLPIVVRAGQRPHQPVASALPAELHGPLQHDLFIG